MNSPVTNLEESAAVKQAPLEKGTLYLVATPIGNLEDITLRALRVLREVDVLLCEDTRHTGRLLQAYSIKRPMVSLHKFNERSRESWVLDELNSGRMVALVSDAGSPCISDPGARLVTAVWENGHRVETIPGPCAVIAGLSVAGFLGEDFYFAGFLPVKQGQRLRRLEYALELQKTIIFYESPYRIQKLLGSLLERVPNRGIAVCRELTKKFEETVRGPVKDVAAQLQQRKPRGEFVVVLSADDWAQGVTDGDEHPKQVS